VSESIVVEIEALGSPESAAEATTLKGKWLHVARGAWLCWLALNLVVFSAAIRNLLTYLPSGGPPAAASVADLLASTYFQVLIPAILDGLFALAFGTVALVLAFRKSNDWLVLGISLALIMYSITAALTLSYLRYDVPVWDPLVAFLEVLSTASVPILAYLFPDGRFVPRWTRWLALMWGAWALAIPFVPAINPYSWPPLPLYLLFVGTLASAIGAQVYRYRREATPAQRQQTKWVVFGFAAATIGFSLLSLFLWFGPLAHQIGYVQSLYTRGLFYLSQIFVPVCIGISVMRYRLWDIDFVVNRTIVYSIVMSIVALFFYVGTRAGNQLVRAVMGQSSQLAPLASGVLSVMLFPPLKARTQGFVDSKFYREKVDLQTAFAEFAHEIRRIADSDALFRALLDRICDLLKLRYGAVYVHGDEGDWRMGATMNLPTPELGDWTPDPEALSKLDLGLVVSRPNDRDFPLLVPVSPPLQAHATGTGSPAVTAVLGLGHRHSGSGFSRDERALLLSLADQVGTAIYLADMAQTK